MPLIIENLSYTYPAAETAALDGLCLRVEDGECIGVMGRTGCGKTTLLQLMAGLLPPSGGRVLIDGADIWAKGFDRHSLRGRVGLVFQHAEQQLFARSVEQDVAFGPRRIGLRGAALAARVDWALETMGFSPAAVKGLSPLALSGGEKRRVAIAGVLALRPKLLLFDEPVAGLDPRGREDFLRLIAALNRDGTTVVMVSHNADAIGECARRVLVLENGRLCLDGSVETVFGDVKRLRALHLEASTAREVAEMLTARGLPLPADTVAYGQLLAALKARLGARP